MALAGDPTTVTRPVAPAATLLGTGGVSALLAGGTARMRRVPAGPTSAAGPSTDSSPTAPQAALTVPGASPTTPARKVSPAGHAQRTRRVAPRGTVKASASVAPAGTVWESASPSGPTRNARGTAPPSPIDVAHSSSSPSRKSPPTNAGMRSRGTISSTVGRYPVAIKLILARVPASTKVLTRVQAPAKMAGARTMNTRRTTSG
mmetsp:Transcript_2055/g.8015  ORF Transcript_2055/g.8015 Transcript_2055/m.8015 type:complete len:204 (-) Transcript_2055:749-1360(-)